MKKKTKEESVKRAKMLVKRLGTTFIDLGGELKLIYEYGWYAPYTSFRDFCSVELDLHYRKAMNLMAIYAGISGGSLSKKVSIEVILGIGWSKLSVIATKLSGPDAEMWLKF